MSRRTEEADHANRDHSGKHPLNLHKRRPFGHRCLPTSAHECNQVRWTPRRLRFAQGWPFVAIHDTLHQLSVSQVCPRACRVHDDFVHQHTECVHVACSHEPAFKIFGRAMHQGTEMVRTP